MSAYEERFARNPFTRAQQAALRKAKFAIVGLGGTGGFMLENLLRMGAERLMVFDHDRFELSNFNRQSLATEDFVGMPKTHAAMARARAINGSVSIEAFGRLDGSSAGELGRADVVLDGTDSLAEKLEVARTARKAKRPYVFCSAQGSRGIVSVFTAYRFEKAFALPKGEEPGPAGPKVGDTLCPAASLAGTLAASQAVNVVLGKPFIRAPEALFFDLSRRDIFWRATLG